MFYHPDTQKTYTSDQCQTVLKLVGVNAENCEDVGLFVPVTPTPPTISITQRLQRSELPTETDGVWTYGWTVEDLPITSAMVKAERDRRLQLDFEFGGKMFQRDPKSIARISGAGTLALAAIMGGAQAGDYRWHGEDTDFSWIASDDSSMIMDAPTCFAFGTKAAKVESNLIHKAKTLREMDPIPSDYADDKYW